MCSAANQTRMRDCSQEAKRQDLEYERGRERERETRRNEQRERESTLEGEGGRKG